MLEVFLASSNDEKYLVGLTESVAGVLHGRASVTADKRDKRRDAPLTSGIYAMIDYICKAILKPRYGKILRIRSYEQHKSDLTSTDVMTIDVT